MVQRNDQLQRSGSVSSSEGSSLLFGGRRHSSCGHGPQSSELTLQAAGRSSSGFAAVVAVDATYGRRSQLLTKTEAPRACLGAQRPSLLQTPLPASCRRSRPLVTLFVRPSREERRGQISLRPFGAQPHSLPTAALPSEGQLADTRGKSPVSGHCCTLMIG